MVPMDQQHRGDAVTTPEPEGTSSEGAAVEPTEGCSPGRGAT